MDVDGQGVVFRLDAGNFAAANAPPGSFHGLGRTSRQPQGCNEAAHPFHKEAPFPFTGKVSIAARNEKQMKVSTLFALA